MITDAIFVTSKTTTLNWNFAARFFLGYQTFRRLMLKQHLSTSTLLVTVALLMMVIVAPARGQSRNFTISVPNYSVNTISFPQEPSTGILTTVTFTESLPYSTLPNSASAATSTGTSDAAKAESYIRGIWIVGIVGTMCITFGGF
jgi:hypothetical protein